MVIKINEDINNKDLEDILEIKKYLSRIYSVLPEDIRDKLKQLNVSKKKKKKIVKEIAFLPKQKQYEYLDEFK